MKAILVVSIAFLVLQVSLADAQVHGQLQLYNDQSGVDCIIQDLPGLVTVSVYYFNYFGDEGISALQFGAPAPTCFVGAIWLGDQTPWPIWIGDSQMNDPSGLSIALGGCQTPPVHIANIVYFAQGLSQTCCPYPVIKAPLDNHPEFPGMPIGVDCALPDPGVFGIVAGTSYINGNHTCPCIWPVPVQETTWGGVKALYQ
jgi:hypothetical protein